jgi:hypothetical protein
MGERMFSDPFTAVMALIILAFIGTLAVFLRIWRELDSLRASIRELKDSMQFYAVDASQQNRDLAAALLDLRANADASAKPENGAGETCLGDLLEKGLPNLRGEHREDEDLIRRLRDGISTDRPQK